MPEDLYNDGPEEAAAPAPKDDQEPTKTALLPKHCFPDARPGDTISVTVVNVHEDEIEVEAAGCETAEKPESGSQEPEEDNGPMRSMLED